MVVSMFGLQRGVLLWTEEDKQKDSLVPKVQLKAGWFQDLDDFERNDGNFTTELRLAKPFFSHLFKLVHMCHRERTDLKYMYYLLIYAMFREHSYNTVCY